MNATPANMNPLGSAAPAPASRPQQMPDTSFSQVLSKEMAQKPDSPPAQARPESPQQAGEAADAAPTAPPGTTEAATDGETARDAQDPSQRAAAVSENAATALTDAGLPALPDAMLALAMSPDLARAAVTATPEAGTAAGPLAAGGDIARRPDGRPGTPAGKASTVPPHDRARGEITDARLTATGAAATPAAVSAASAATAAAFSGQLAALRQADLKPGGERIPDLVGATPAPTTPQALLDAAAALDSTAASGRLAPSVGSTAWSQALGEKIVWMAAGAQHTASLTLNPPNLGPLQIVLNVSSDQASASFFSAQPEVRQALEAAMPKLRDMMNEAGIQLGQSTVSAETPQHNAQDGRASQRSAAPFDAAGDAAGSALLNVGLPLVRQGRGLVDTFA
jgi:flagellar hook-length control protein FliK